MRSKTIDKFYPEEKVSKKCFINRTKKPVERSKPILKRNKKFFLPKKHQTAVHVTVSRSNGRNESQATKFNSYQFSIP